jgi:peptidoglycan hydrolase-like protein with peptidoglycan-binding domain
MPSKTTRRQGKEAGAAATAGNRATYVHSKGNVVASWVFGSFLLVILLAIIFILPEPSDFQRSLIRFFMALGAAFLSFFFVGGVVLRGNVAGQAIGGGGGFVLFILLQFLVDPFAIKTRVADTAPGVLRPDDTIASAQRVLKSAGYYHGDVNGIADSATREAIKVFQSKKGIQPDGYVGPKTREQLSGPTILLTGDRLKHFTAGEAKKLVGAGNGAAAIFLRSDRCSAAMVNELHNAGLKLWSIYEKGMPTSDNYFSVTRGTQDGSAAAAFAKSIGQPEGTQIYSAVDYDPSEDAINHQISDYMRAFQASIRPFGYLASVYGSGRTCRILMDKGLAKTGWLVGATGFSEYHTFKPRAGIVQSPSSDDDSDHNEIRNPSAVGLW